MPGEKRWLLEVLIQKMTNNTDTSKQKSQPTKTPSTFQSYNEQHVEMLLWLADGVQ
jgi:hypothetical protein